MAETKLIRDHHLLTRNLKLNDNYISNDGGDEGIRISDAGVVTASSQIDIGNMTLTTSELDVSSGDLTIDVAGDITLDAGGADVTLSSTTGLVFTQTSNDWVITNALNDADIIFNSLTSSVAAEVMRIDGSARSLLVASGKKVEFGASGDNISGTGSALTIEGGGDITLDAVGDIILDAGGENITLKGSAGDGLDFVHHHSGTWDIRNLTQDKDIAIKINDGGSSTSVMDINGAEPYIEFPNSSVGFSRKEAIFSTTAIIGSGGTDDTDIDFRTGNKFRLEMTGDITTINLIFPTVSGNFLLVCTTNGDHDVTNWKVYESDETAATIADVMWAGGSVPAFTNNGIDIVSFYWDANEQQAYGVASLAFATP